MSFQLVSIAVWQSIFWPHHRAKVRYIPEWIPGSFKRQNRKAYETGQRIFHEPLKNIQEQMVRPSLR